MKAPVKFADLVKFARKNSSFYRELYASAPADVTRVEELPVLNQDSFWKACGLENNGVLTGPMKDGIVFKSGGTTGNPKFSIFSKEEWKLFNEIFGKGIASGIVQNEDRVANLFYVGQLYGSFLFINKSFEEAPCDVLQLPIGGSTTFQETYEIVRDFEVNVLAGVPTTLLNFAEFCHQMKSAKKPLKVEKILFGGEAFYSDQRARLGEVFPGVQIHSIGYASTDAGLLGYADKSCSPTEHRFFDQYLLFEILDEEHHSVIEEQGKEGRIVVTNLTRSLMPIIRYPVGDRGMWVEPKGTRDRKFKLLGRSDEAARIGLVKLYVEDVRNILNGFREEMGIHDFQMIVIHQSRMDGLILKIASTNSDGLDSQTKKSRADKITHAIYQSRPLYEEFVKESKIHPIQVEWVKPKDLTVNPRTGKMKKVIDLRLNS